MPVKIDEQDSGVEICAGSRPALLQFNSSGGVEPSRELIRSVSEVSDGFVYLEGRDMEGPDDMLIDDWQSSEACEGGQKYSAVEPQLEIGGNR